jgi:type II secretory pathway component PulF
MALYEYKALTKTGIVKSGTLDAASDSAARAELVAKGLYPVSIKLHTTSTLFSFGNLFQATVSQKDLIFFTKQLAVLLRSGVPLLQALELLIDQFTGKLKSILITLKDNIKEGKSLADGMEQYPLTFSRIYMQLVRAGEASGKLEFILDKLVQYLERQTQIQSKVQGALMMPIIQLVVMFVAIIFLMVAVVPKITDMVSDLGKELPTATLAILAISNFLIDYHIALLVGVLLLTLGFAYAISTPQGKRVFDQMKLYIPVVQYFSRTSAVIQFCSTLGMLLESGVNLSAGLEIVDKIIDNTILRDTLQEAKDKIIKQGKITPFLKETKLFPPIALYLIKTGEESGQLDQMLTLVSQNYEGELNDFTDNLTTALGPIMTVVMGGLIGFIMMAVMGPMMALQQI